MTDTDRAIALPDGRALWIRTVGAARGTPVLFLGGIPGACRLDADHHAEAADRAGLELIALDRPGTGRSDRHPSATLSDWSRDVEDLLDALQIDRIAIASVSGGSAYALAAAHDLPHRIHHVTLVAPAWMPDDRSTRGMPWANRLLWWLAHHSRPLFSVFVGRGLLAAMRNPETSLASRFPEVDRAVMVANPQIEARIKAGFLEACREGPEGVIDDAIRAVSPPPWSLADVRVPVALWHGEADENAPVAHGRALAGALPRCEARFVPGEGHISLLAHHMDAILDAIPRGSTRPGAISR